MIRVHFTINPLKIIDYLKSLKYLFTQTIILPHSYCTLSKRTSHFPNNRRKLSNAAPNSVQCCRQTNATMDQMRKQPHHHHHELTMCQEQWLETGSQWVLRLVLGDLFVPDVRFVSYYWWIHCRRRSLGSSRAWRQSPRYHCRPCQICHCDGAEKKVIEIKLDLIRY